MEDITIFIFGLVATLLAIGPLAVAFYLDIGSKDEEKDQLDNELITIGCPGFQPDCIKLTRLKGKQGFKLN